MALLSSFRTVFLLLYISDIVLSQNLFSNREVASGEKTFLTCNARAAGVTNAAGGVVKLEVTKHVGNAEPVKLMSYGRGGANLQEYKEEGPASSSYNVDAFGLFPTEGSVMVAGNQDKMMITIDFYSTQCSDEGMYKCYAEYFPQMDSNNPIPSENHQNLTVEAPVQVQTRFVEAQPVRLEYDPTESVNFTCKANGPEDTVFQWWYVTREDCNSNNFADEWRQYTDGNNIKTDAPEPFELSSGCKSYRHTSRLMNIRLDEVLSFPFQSDGNLCKVQCRVGTGGSIGALFEQDFNDTMTLLYGGDDDPGASTSGDDVPVGAIVGPIIGVLAIVAIVAILLYFCWYRKKTKGDAYRDEPDKAEDPNLHSAPPVFYTKPAKDADRDNEVIGVHNEALDNSYDSNSPNRARYANTPEYPDSNGPPRYEKESHRGRSNRGYDDGGDGRRQDGDDRRERDRRDRDRHDRDRHDERRDQNRHEGKPEPEDRRPYRRRDEEPRSRRYSTEDGNGTNDQVMFDNYGNPNMGTAI